MEAFKKMWNSSGIGEAKSVAPAVENSISKVRKVGTASKKRKTRAAGAVRARDFRDLADAVRDGPARDDWTDLANQAVQQLDWKCLAILLAHKAVWNLQLEPLAIEVLLLRCNSQTFSNEVGFEKLSNVQVCCALLQSALAEPAEHADELDSRPDSVVVKRARKEPAVYDHEANDRLLDLILEEYEGDIDAKLDASLYADAYGYVAQDDAVALAMLALTDLYENVDWIETPIRLRESNPRLCLSELASTVCAHNCACLLRVARAGLLLS